DHTLPPAPPPSTRATFESRESDLSPPRTRSPTEPFRGIWGRSNRQPSTCALRSLFFERTPLIALIFTLAFAQTPCRVVVFEVSASDAVYEDVSRSLAEALVESLGSKGVIALRATENDLPSKGCRFGPCLGKVAAALKADVLVTLDVSEIDSGRLAVAA